MNGNRSGAFQLFRLWGINVFLHWTWFLVAAILLWQQPMFAEQWKWHTLTYISLFGIVLLHEFGHALACRSVGGRADTIILWPLGGIAFVNPPARPGAVLWSIAAGPLVNVLLIPITVGLAVWGLSLTNLDPASVAPDLSNATELQKFLITIAAINISLLVFNMLPIYPLDGGQIVQAVLWFFMGRAKSLHVTAAFGLVCGLAGAAFALWYGRTWLVILALFVAWKAWHGVMIARYLAAQESRQNGL